MLERAATSAERTTAGSVGTSDAAEEGMPKAENQSFRVSPIFPRTRANLDILESTVYRLCPANLFLAPQPKNA